MIAVVLKLRRVRGQGTPETALTKIAEFVEDDGADACEVSAI